MSAQMSNAVSVFGLGYVGTVTAACLAGRGMAVIGVDAKTEKVDAVNAGFSPIVEPGLEDLVRQGHSSGLLRATLDASEAVRGSSTSLVCVGTPSLSNGRVQMDHVRAVATQIAAALRESPKPHTVVFRSTMPPGSTRALVAEFFSGTTTRVLYVPEFLREGSAVHDFLEPSLSVLGTEDGENPAEALEGLGSLDEVLRWEEAEMLKYACNAFHALKAGFANEMGRVGKFLGLDARRVMAALGRDERLNISRAYLKPGNPIGGSCLPKDVGVLAALARSEGLKLPLIEQMMDSNQAHLDHLTRLVEATGARRVGFLGLAFKAGTDDLRGSPMVSLAETLLGRGHSLRIFDPSVNLTRLIGANEAEIQRRMPHLARLMAASAAEVVSESEVIVASQACASLDELRDCVRADQHVIDVNGWRELETLPWRYEGLCW
jgi:GDP-mannose 6-dehydrogenase